MGEKGEGIKKYKLVGIKQSQSYKVHHRDLAGVAQWIEYWPVNQKITGLVPGQGTCLGCRPGPHWGVCERQPHIDVSLPLSLPSHLSKNK